MQAIPGRTSFPSLLAPGGTRPSHASATSSHTSLNGTFTTSDNLSVRWLLETASAITLHPYAHAPHSHAHQCCGSSQASADGAQWQLEWRMRLRRALSNNCRIHPSRAYDAWTRKKNPLRPLAGRYAFLNDLPLYVLTGASSYVSPCVRVSDIFIFDSSELSANVPLTCR